MLAESSGKSKMQAKRDIAIATEEQKEAFGRVQSDTQEIKHQQRSRIAVKENS